MVGIYLSGTGNTEHCVKKLLSIIEPEAESYPIESEEALSKIKENETIILGYPTMYSNIPYMVRDFIVKNQQIWKNKKVLLFQHKAFVSL